MRYAFLRRNHGPSALSDPSSGYSLAARVAGLRSGIYASYFTNTTDPFAPNGLELPTAPTITSTVTVSSLANLATELSSGSGKQITLTPGTYTQTSGQAFSVSNGISDCRVIVSNCTINITGDAHSFSTGWNTNRIEIICTGATFNAIPEIQGSDIKVYGYGGCSMVGDNVDANFNTNGSGLGWYGRRVVVEGVYARGFYGLAFVGTPQTADFVADISGTTMTVSTVYEGTLREGQSLLAGGGGGSFAAGTRVGTQVSGTTGGAGVYNVTPSQTRSSSRAQATEPAVNCIFANCDLEVPKSDNGNHVENPFRFNGGNFCIGIDSRAWAAEASKHTIRSHGDAQNEYTAGLHAYINCQLENQGLYANGWTAGIIPEVEKLILYGNTFYTPQTGTYSSSWGIDYDLQVNINGISGNGTTVTVTLEGLNRHKLSTGDTVIIIPTTGIPSGFAATGVTITVTGALTFTYANTTTGTYGGNPGDYCGSITSSLYRNHVAVDARNNLRYSAPAYTTNNTGIVPVGAGVPTSNYPTLADAATSLSYGNENLTYVSTPAWSMYSTTPT